MLRNFEINVLNQAYLRNSPRIAALVCNRTEERALRVRLNILFSLANSDCTSHIASHSLSDYFIQTNGSHFSRKERLQCCKNILTRSLEQSGSESICNERLAKS